MLSLPLLEDDKLEVIACESADAALIDVLARLDEVSVGRCFSTWVYKFAVVEAATRVRKLAWETGEALTSEMSMRLYNNLSSR